MGGRERGMSITGKAKEKLLTRLTRDGFKLQIKETRGLIIMVATLEEKESLLAIDLHARSFQGMGVMNDIMLVLLGR
ncbi:unnamed protein product [Eruca vesicaria subsp. sativa]|uniref:Uncharacterized protein n=1 Tax=Eruca vesicaria subsp. sativa TaxID=29727 RepID=A0ABC8J546_ERUVS|nr:unnamed protein product [Eruca vesicaria subsp. sativa]